MYAEDDIRSSLTPASPTAAHRVDPSTPVFPAQFHEPTAGPPTETTPAGSRSWVLRGANWVLIWTDAVAGDILTRTGQRDEYLLPLFSESAQIRVLARDDERTVKEEALVVVPPGDSSVEVLTDGPVLRLFTSHENPDLVAIAGNRDSYEPEDPRVAPWQPWPDPVGGFALRVYPLRETPITEGRFGRIFRTTNFMINFLAEEPAPRDPLKLSPHHHDDFEQISVAVKGEFIHHIRYPWGPDSTRWRDDEHARVGSPSVTIIPPPTVHTTQGIGPHQQLLDIFSPPREDFSNSGWVLNAEEYPQP